MFIADFHIHSKYSRATSRDLEPVQLDLWARRKGLGLIGTGDFTHPAWRQELRDKLVPAEEGLYRLRDEFRQRDAIAGPDRGPRFLVTGEISTIYKKNGRVRKVHSLILLPGLEEAEALSGRLEAIGNLRSDGRPILGLDCRDLLEITLDTCPTAMFIPAHIWTPHFSLFGAYSGFDAIEECFEDLTGHIRALETGLSSDPPMNRRLSALDDYLLVSNSDAHSPGNLAREANLFETDLSYPAVRRALEDRTDDGFRGTIEFFPEEGKYHFDGHRNCGVCQSPRETLALGGKCPVCGKPVTVGVSHRVEALADREEGFVPPGARPFESLVPLPEVIAASTGYSPKSIKGRAVFDRFLAELGPELSILREADLQDITRVAGPGVAEGIRRLRTGEIDVSPGFDGEYGKVSILGREEIQELSGQLRLFFQAEKAARPPRKPAPRKGGAKAAPAPARVPENTLPGEDLNRSQEAAVRSREPVIAVIAGPGTGKTRTLVARIARLVRDGASPASITAVTFTNKAAAEMRERLERELGGRALREMTIGTFHAIGLEQLRRAGRDAAVIDGDSAAALLEELLRETDAKGKAREALRRISLLKCGGLPEENHPLPDGLFEAYCARLGEFGVLDYDDILLRALELAQEEGFDGTPFTHLLVDEFQDTNPVQYQLIRAWSRASDGLFVIGDPDQSIYGFRGSDPRCFAWLRRDCPGLEAITLTQNYRSFRQILEASAAVARPAAPPFLEARRGEGPSLRLVEADTAFAEALFVVKEINRLVGGIDMLDSDRAGGGPGRGFSDMAVLTRTHRQAALLEDCMVQEGIPFVVAGRDDELAGPEARRFLAFFRVLASPGDLLSLWTCLAGLGVRPEAARGLLARYRPVRGDLRALPGLLREQGGEALAGFAGELEAYAGLAGSPPGSLLDRRLSDTGERCAPWADKLLRMAVFHDSMEDLLRTLALGGEPDLRRYGGKRYTGDAVSLLTLHGSKGLEFPTVFLCGVSKGLIPYEAHGFVSDPEEERRLLYVGMTRARDELVMLHSREASPFVGDIPRKLVEAVQAGKPRGAREFVQTSLFD